MSKQKHTEKLSERSLLLFKLLVEYFIHGGQPVGSRTLARSVDFDLSAATIRNIMADLEDMGLLRSPHTSAGRVPTARGYRLFVDSLLKIDDLDGEAKTRIEEEFKTIKDARDLLEKTSFVLSDITHFASVVMLPRAEQSTLQQIEFVALSENRILVVLVMSDAKIQNRIIHTARPLGDSDLERAANYLNQNFAGKDLRDIRENMFTELQRMREDVSSLMQAAIEIATEAVDTSSAGDDYVLAGQTNLMGIRGWDDMDRLKRLFDTFNQKRDILHLLDQAIHAGGVQLFIGEESGYEVLDDCSIITSPYECEGRILGVLGVIGPTRMDYEHVIPIVDLAAKKLGSALNSRTSSP